MVDSSFDDPELPEEKLPWVCGFVMLDVIRVTLADCFHYRRSCVSCPASSRFRVATWILRILFAKRSRELENISFVAAALSTQYSLIVIVI